MTRPVGVSHLLECLTCNTLKKSKDSKGKHCDEDMVQVGWVEELHDNPSQEEN